MRVYIIRHADPDYSIDNLTPTGHLEAQALAERMASESQRPHRIYCSPLGRALATAGYTARRLNLEPVVEEWTQEMSDCRIERSPWGRLTAWDCPGEIIRAAAPYPTADDWHEGEGFRDAAPLLRRRYAEMQQNSDTFFTRHGYRREGGRYRVVEPNRLRLAVFCHGGFGLTWLAHLLEIPLPLVWSGFWLPPSSVTTILFDERSADWAVPRCIGLGDLSHLYHAGLPTSPSGIKANYD